MTSHLTNGAGAFIIESMDVRERIEECMSEYPICEYAFLTPSEIPFRRQVRHICETECPRYGTSWSCPPAVGTVEECRARCLEFGNALIFTTIAEEVDIEDMSAMLATRREHEAVTTELRDRMADFCGEMLVLSTESCAICEKCAYPYAPCRHPELMFPCIESYGILVTKLADDFGITFMNQGNVVTWFSLILYG